MDLKVCEYREEYGCHECPELPIGACVVSYFTDKEYNELKEREIVN